MRHRFDYIDYFTVSTKNWKGKSLQTLNMYLREMIP